MIKLTDTAAAEFQRLIQEQGDAASVVRIGVESGGCSGLQYTMDFSDERHDSDAVFEQASGLTVLVDKEALSSISGLTVDFSSKLMGGGFRFENPNATRRCGCGTSFTL